MAYLPKHRQKKGGKPKGKLIDPKTGLAWLGAFLMDFLGNFFKGDKFDPNAEPLTFIPDAHGEEEDSLHPSVELTNDYNIPTEDDIERGKYKRNFVQDKRSNRVAEVSKDELNRIRKKNLLYLKALSIDWITEGFLEDRVNNGYLESGVKSKNRATIDQAEKIMPGIAALIDDNYGQFVNGAGLSQDDYVNDFNTNSNQDTIEDNLEYKNSQAVQEGLFTDGTEFWYEGTEVAYAGPYHIHPEMGPMIGEKHLKEFHSKLVRINNSKLTSDIDVNEDTVTPEGLKVVKGADERSYKKRRINYY